MELIGVSITSILPKVQQARGGGEMPYMPYTIRQQFGVERKIYENNVNNILRSEVMGTRNFRHKKRSGR